MSLGGIAIAIGAMVDAAIVMIEAMHRRIEKEKLTNENRWRIVSECASEVGPALFYSLAIITVSFLPVFVLESQEGRLFKPLAFTKTYAMAAAAILSITLVPVLMGYFVRGRILPERKNPLNRIVIWIALARIAAEVNLSVENIGARRLYTVLERVFEELSFNAPDREGESITVDAAFVEQHLGELAKSTDLSRYVL